MDASQRMSGARGAAGFTVIELMIVVAIVSILAVIALPAYLEYATRSKVSEGLGFIGEAKTSVSERFYSTNQWPVNNFDAGLPEPDSYEEFAWVSRLVVTQAPHPGTIELTFNLPNTPAHNKRLWLVPSTVTGQIMWTCQPAIPPEGIASRFVPPNCRN